MFVRKKIINVVKNVVKNKCCQNNNVCHNNKCCRDRLMPEKELFFTFVLGIFQQQMFRLFFQVRGFHFHAQPQHLIAQAIHGGLKIQQRQHHTNVRGIMRVGQFRRQVQFKI